MNCIHGIEILFPFGGTVVRTKACSLCKARPQPGPRQPAQEPGKLPNLVGRPYGSPMPKWFPKPRKTPPLVDLGVLKLDPRYPRFRVSVLPKQKAWTTWVSPKERSLGPIRDHETGGWVGEPTLWVAN